MTPLLEEVEDGNVKDHTREQEPDSEERQGDIEDLADNVKPEHLSAVHLLGQLLEIGVETDACESQDESPVLVLVENAVDFLYGRSTKDRLDYK